MTTNRSMPPGGVIPEFAYPDAREAVDWLRKTFGFKERLRIGNHRAQLVFGNGSMIVTQRNDACEMAGHSVMVCVEDVDRHHQQAKEHGAQIISPPADYPYGERQYTVKDPGGHYWTFSQTIADVDPDTWGGELFE